MAQERLRSVPVSRPRDRASEILAIVREALEPHGLKESGLWTTIAAERPESVTLKGEWEVLRDKELQRAAKEASEGSAISHQVVDFVERACELYNAGHADAGLDLIYDVTDEMLTQVQFSLLDSILFRAQVSGCPSDIIMALLVTTAAGTSKLSTRQEFVQRAIAELDKRPEFDKRAIKHLRP
jgi:hypothetical protein